MKNYDFRTFNTKNITKSVNPSGKPIPARKESTESVETYDANARKYLLKVSYDLNRKYMPILSGCSGDNYPRIVAEIKKLVDEYNPRYFKKLDVGIVSSFVLGKTGGITLQYTNKYGTIVQVNSCYDTPVLVAGHETCLKMKDMNFFRAYDAKQVYGGK